MSEVNVNLCDMYDYFKGVWMLLFNYVEKDMDWVCYIVIGESDWMMLKFIKLCW